MLKIIKKELLRIIDNIDSGNSQIDEEQALETIKFIQEFMPDNSKYSKYKACQYLNVSRATFDNYVRQGKLPQGKKEIGFKELSWNKKDLDKFIKESKNERNK